MNPKATRNLILRISEYGMDKDEFTILQLYKDLKIEDSNTQDYIWSSLTSTRPGTDNPNHILVLIKERTTQYDGRTVSHPDHGSLFRVTPTALYNYIDYQEIVEARKASKQAFWLAMASIILSLVVGVTQIVIESCKG